LYKTFHESLANIVPLTPWQASRVSLTRQASWKMANNWIISVLAPVASASRSPFSNTLWLSLELFQRFELVVEPLVFHLLPEIVQHSYLC